MASQPNLGARVRALRRRANLSQAKLAESLGISASYLNLIEHNRRRLSAELMFKAADILKVDVRDFAVDEAASLHADMMDALSDPMFDELEVKAVDVRDMVDQHPGVAGAITLLYRKYQSVQESVRNLGGLVLDGTALDGVDTSRLPSEEVNDLVQRRRNYFPELEEVVDDLWKRFRLRQATLFDGMCRVLDQEHGIEVRVRRAREAGSVVRQFDPHRKVLFLSETLPPRSRHFQMAHQIGLLGLSDLFDRIAADPQLTTDTSRRLCRMVLANYFAGAMLMPYEQFLTAAEDERYDVELLGHRFRTSFEQVAHRLTTLRREGREGVPFHFLKTDTAGNISKRFSGSGIPFARFSGGCPLWNVNTAFMYPGRIRRQLSQMPDGKIFFCIARTVQKRHGGFLSPESVYAIGLGCLVEHAHRLVYAEGMDLERQEIVRIGTNCRVCERLDCDHRAFPSLKAPLDLDENVRRIAFYASEGG